MDLTPYVDKLGREFAAAAEAGGEEARELAERLSAPLESAIRLTLLEALSSAAAEITQDLAPGSVEVLLRGRDPHFVVTPPASPEAGQDGAASSQPADGGFGAAEQVAEDGVTARINFRLPEHLKIAIEEAASQVGRSVNAWLVRVTSAALTQADPAQQGERSGTRSRQRYTGWVH
ncbi:hypothetical protein EV191_11157 [Tamaricihabitans halophyticus]|uniref:HicB-like protein involved in pilus formation n=1 Tax=Tamaricihabitans halophyticus TaxID=1262583 RepID=A0A4R2QFE0_9PSEU|nr:hypothetical protein [Tamaricihabitans halophyticus]TCP47852.1 hypothetical protein EV191_11157 [Tamaricihabitans halophyticus]